MTSKTISAPVTRMRKYWFPILAFALLAMPIFGMWELFRADRQYAEHASHLFMVFLAILFLATIALLTGYFTTRDLLSDANVAADRLRMVMASGRSVGWEWDLKRGRDYWFGDLRTMFGIQSDTWSGHVEEFFRYVHPEDRQRVSQAATDARVKHKQYEAEFRVVRQDGAVRWVTARASFDYRKSGQPERMLGVAVDITDRKDAEKGLRNSEEKFSKAFRESPMALTLTSAKDHRYLDVNETFEHMSGWQRDEVVGRTPFDLQIWMNPDDGIEFAKRLQTEGSIRNLQVHFRCKDGTERVGLSSAELIEIANEPCIISVIADITESRQFQEKLRESQERLGGVIDSAMDAIIAIDEEQRIVLFNPAAEKMFGCAADRALHTTIDRFIPQRFWANQADLIRRFAESGVTDRSAGAPGGLWGVRANGAEFPIEASISQTNTKHGKLFTVIIRDMTERYRTEKARRQSEERLHLAVQAGRMYADEWDSASDTIIRSPEFAEILGSDQSIKTTRRELLQHVHPDDREQLESFFAGFTPAKPTAQTSYRFLRPDGALIWLEKIARAFFDERGTVLRTVGVVADVTDRKQAELALRESEERFRLVANTVPVMIWMSGRDKMRTYFNQQWLDFTGRPLEAELGSGWAEGVHPEDLAACLEIYRQAFDKQEVFNMRYRLRRNDGEYRWIENRGVPRFEVDGSFAGHIGSCNDVSDREQAAAMLGSLGRRLIEAHEEERTWIARELHDDINQRLALLAIELEQWKQHVPESAVAFAFQIEQARTRIFDISKEVQALSHRLHSSKLEYLGLATASKSFCRELSDQIKVRIDFTQSDVPRKLPPEVSLALFRVLQEALQNAVKHSRAQDFRVELRGGPGKIDLAISDRGTGFDQTEALRNRGLGLISMRERLQLVNGTLAIESQPGHGTTIRARVPIKADEEASPDLRRMTG